jgi:hypothetical protein
MRPSKFADHCGITPASGQLAREHPHWQIGVTQDDDEPKLLF